MRLPPLPPNLQRAAAAKTLPAGAVLLDVGAPVRHLPVVTRGSVRVVRPHAASGQELLLYHIRPGESCVMSFRAGLQAGRSAVKAVVEAPGAEVLLLPVAPALDWLRAAPAFAEFLFGLYHQRYEELLAAVEALAFAPAAQRLLGLLRQKAALGAGPALALTHGQVAEQLGLSREAVSRLLKRLERAGQIELGRGKIRLL